MNNNQIKNPKTEVPTGIALNDKDYLDSLLSCLKEMVKNYATALTEASNESLYQQYKTMLENYSDLQREAFELMFRKGWYILEKSEVQKINTKYQTLSKELTDLNS